MRASSRASSSQGEFDFGSAEANVSADHEANTYDSPNGSGASLRLPTFDRLSSVYADTARIAGRINALAVPEEEVQRLHTERAALLDKQEAGATTPQDINRLKYVRWSLDRIEDAHHGHELEQLEKAISEYENFGDDVGRLIDELKRYGGGR